MIYIVRPSSVGLTINRCSVPQRQGSVRTVDEERGGVDVGIVRQPGRVSIHPPSIGHIECRTSHCSTNKSKILNWSSFSSLTNQVIFFFSSISTFRASYLYRFCLGWWLSVPAQWPWGPGTVWSRRYTHTYSSHWCLYSDGHRCLLSHIHQYLKSHQLTSMYSHHQQITSICVLHLKKFLSGYSYYWLFIILFCNDIFIII